MKWKIKYMVTKGKAYYSEFDFDYCTISPLAQLPIIFKTLSSCKWGNWFFTEELGKRPKCTP